MFELIGLGMALFAIVTLVAILWAAATLFCWLLTLPFRLLGLAFQGIGLVLAMPFVLFAGLVIVLVFGVGAVFALLPVFPVLLLFAALIWLLRRPHKTGAAH